jgi:predicted TIM-barrel fold metal-dependent hydrolase
LLRGAFRAATFFDGSAPMSVPHNRTHVNFRAIPPRKIPGKIIDIHSHCHNVDQTKLMLEVADAYNIGRIWTMAPLEDVDPFNAAYPDRFRFVAVPKWQEVKDGVTDAFVDDWLRRLDGFYARGARLFKLHLAPGTKDRWKISADHPRVRRVIDHAYQLGYHFMTHVGDPKAWWKPGKAYIDTAKFEPFEKQFAGLDAMLAEFPDRMHLGAHMGGSLEDLPALQARLDRFPHYIVDTSATKWITRAVAEQSFTPEGRQRLRDFFIRNADRILFGSDLVVGEKHTWDHYASRYWTHQMMWETNFDAESPIEDPDAIDGIPRLIGLDLPADVLAKMYRTNAERYLESL